MKLYKHFKNKPYKFIGTARHSETQEEMVIYEALYENPNGKLWVRPRSMFMESVTRDGLTQPRFSPVPLKIQTTQEVGERHLQLIRPLIEKVFDPPQFENFQETLELRNKTVFLVTGHVNDALAGFKLGYQSNHETFYSWLGAVDPGFRCLGVGSALMAAQHDWCRSRGFKKIQTETKNKWREMIVLNIKSGFQIIGAYTDEKGEPKVILEKHI